MNKVIAPSLRRVALAKERICRHSLPLGFPVDELGRRCAMDIRPDKSEAFVVDGRAMVEFSPVERADDTSYVFTWRAV